MYLPVNANVFSKDEQYIGRQTYLMFPGSSQKVFCAVHKKRTSHQRSQNFFPLLLKAVGCPYITLPTNAKSSLKGDILTIVCNNTRENFQLKCLGNEWLGQIPNCSASKLCFRKSFSLETIEFFLNVCTEFTEKIDIYCILKRLFEPASSCVRDQDATAAPARQVAEGIFKLSPIPASVIYQIP